MGIMLVYDVTSEKSFKGVASWISKIAENCDKNINKILLANKCDLKEKREITRERGEELAGRLGIPYVEISALSNLNVEEAFATLAKDIFNSLSHSGENGETENDFKPAKKSSCMSCWRHLPFFSEMNQIILHLPQNEATRIICFIGGAVKFLSWIVLG